MAILLKPLKCPHCTKPIDKRLLQTHNQLQAFLRNKPFACPHCDQKAVFPEKTDTIVSSGLFVAVILAPLFHYWQVEFISGPQLFLLGFTILVVGICSQKLEKTSRNGG